MSPPPRDSAFSDTPLILKSYELYRPVAKTVITFPKPWRYSIGEKLQHAILTLVEQTTQALYARKPLKESYILKILGTIQTAQLFVRLCLEEALITERQFFDWSDKIAELSRMAGGWLASVRSNYP